MTRADSYKRGTPQRITRANGNKIYQYVDNFGRITSIIDGNRQSTSYSRDAMGRLLVVNPPGSWENTHHSYDFNDSPEHTITMGNARSVISYDEMFRPVLIETRDLLTDIATFVNYDYDAAGREIFASFPSTSRSNSAGITSEYDGLRRLTKKRETVAPFAQRSLSYHGSHRRTETNPNGHKTDYYSYGYDGPDNNDIREIRSPLGKNTDIKKNVNGETVYIRQWGNQNGFDVDEYRHYYYDSQRRLCRVRQKDVGDTVYDYDKSNWLIAYQKGLSFGTACSTPSGNAKVSLVRDPLGRITHRDYAHSGTADIFKTYDGNSNVLTVNRGGVDWTYSYNTINLPTMERLYIEQNSYRLTHGYNLSGHKTQTVLPSTKRIEYHPDGLGRPRRAKVGSTYYANNVTYHPSGQIHKFNYGNGYYFTQTLNARLLPSRLLANNRGSVKAIDLSYTYDKGQLVSSIIDGDRVGSNSSRNMTYDALEQIKTSRGPWGTRIFNYDSLGNIRNKDLGSRKVTVNYNSSNRVSSSVDTGGIGGSTGTRRFNHDSRGNVTRSGILNFVYDYADQPISISGNLSGQYLYDGNFKRVKSKVGNITIYSMYDLSGKLVNIRKYEYFSRWKSRKSTDYISIGNMTVARVEENVPTYLHSDHLGSPVSGTSASGNVLWKERYSPYGITLDNPAANDDQAGYTGHIKDSDTGLVYMQARYYDPVIGRFYSNDPVDVLGHMGRGNPVHGFGRYTYANNNPYKYVDPDGEFGLVGALIGLGIEGAIQIAQGELNVTKLAVSTIAGGAGVGLGQKTMQLGSMLSNGSKLASTATQVAGNVVEAVATNVIETSTNNIINSVTGANEMENIDASGAATNAVVNTGAGNIADNKLGATGTKKADLFKGAVEGARKVAEELLNDN